MRSLPVDTDMIGQGVLANIIALKTSGEEHKTEIADTCKPKPPSVCGVPNNRASLRLLQASSWTALPELRPNTVTCMPVLLGIKQESLPPAPITVGAIADITGEGLPEPAPL
jgi:hypothetical protein